MPRILRTGEIPARLNPDEFWTQFGRLEHEGLDFKRGVPGDLADTVAAMAMSQGGTIVHGVADDRTIVGCPFSQNTQDRITRTANECGVEVQARPLVVGEIELTLTLVPEVRDRVVTTPNGRLLRRVGGDSQPLRGDAMARFVRARTETSAEQEPVGSDAADWDLEGINRVRVADGHARVGPDGVQRALYDLGLATSGESRGQYRILRAAMVLFARDPRGTIPGATIQLVRRAGTGPGPGPTAAREECIGPLAHLLDCSLRFVERHTRRYEAVTGMRREVVPEYPGTAVREAILNALAHRDYGLAGATIDLTIWDDRLEVRSPGPLPGHITPENMRREHYSRNRRIMQVLKVAGLVEEYGEGVDRMIHAMEARLMEPPIFLATSSSVTVTLRNRFLVSIEDQVWLSLLGHTELSVTEREVLVLARREGTLTPRRLRALLPGVSIRPILRGAVAKGLLVRTGTRGGSRYELSDEIVARAGSASIEAQGRKRQLLLDEIDRRGSLSTVEGAALLGESAAAVRQLLNQMAQSGQVRAAGRTRGRRYFRP